jgi:hypothetical protein
MKLSIVFKVLLILLLFSFGRAYSAPVPCKQEIADSVVVGFGTFVQASADKNIEIKPGQCLVSAARNFMAVLQDNCHWGQRRMALT